MWYVIAEDRGKSGPFGSYSTAEQCVLAFARVGIPAIIQAKEVKPS